MSKLSDHYLHELYDDMLDEVFEPVKIGSLEYSVSRTLKFVDEVAYRCGFNEWLDAQVNDGIFFEKGDEYFDADPSDEGI